MLRILGTRKTLCDGVTRRDFLQIGGIGAFGLSLANAAQVQAADIPGPSFGKAKSCILLFPYGSPSSHETFDPKPELPDVQGEMQAIGTSVPGVHICDHLPRLAKVMDKITAVRSMTHEYPVHGLAYAVTGLPTYTPELETRARDNRQWPFIGSVVDYLARQRSSGTDCPVPRNIGLPWLVNSKTDNPAVNAGPFAAFLGAEYDPLWTDFDGPGLRIAPKSTVDQTKQFLDPFGGTTTDGRFHMSPASELPPDISVERLRMRQSLLAQFDHRPVAALHDRALGLSERGLSAVRPGEDLGAVVGG